MAPIVVLSFLLTSCGSDKSNTNTTTVSTATTSTTATTNQTIPSTTATDSNDQGAAKEATRTGVIPTPTVEAAMSHIAKTPQPRPFKLIRASASTADKVIPEVDHQPIAEFWQARGEPGEFGGTFTVGAFGQGPKTFNKWQAADVESDGICQLMYEDLLAPDPWTGQYYPKLAKSFSISADKKEITFVLRKGLKWSDGHPLTADDVVFTFDTIVRKGYGNSSYRDVLSVHGKFPDVIKIDDLTVKFRTTVPFAPILNGLRVAIAPKHILEKLTKKPVAEFGKFWDVNTDLSTLVVSGPFKVSRYLPAQRVELTRNPNYSMVDSLGRRLPYLNRFDVSIVPDQPTEILKFYGNETDFLDIRAVRGSDAATMKKRETEGGFKMYNLGPDDGTMFIMFNMNRRKNPKGKYYVDPIKQKWFESRSFRQAVSHAINRKQIISNVLRGVGLPLYTAESPASIYVDKNLGGYAQDLVLAADLLATDGFVKKGEWLYDKDGHQVEFTLNTNAGNTTRDAVCVMVVNELKKLGIKANYQPIDFNILIDKVETSLDWQAVVMGLTGDKLEPYNGANIWKSNGRLHMFNQRLPAPDGSIPVTDARDFEIFIDQCFDKGATTFDPAERRKLFDAYQEVAYDELPFIYLYSTLDITAMKNKVGNYMPTPLGIWYTPKGSLHNIEEIYIKKAVH
ncbi:ABC transporter substrate-binding protein [soil metagenome]